MALVSQMACGAATEPVVSPLPERATTAGDGQLSAAPLGADLILEVDLARLRNNAVVGTILTALSGPDQREQIVEGDLLTQADALLVCVYGIGDSAKQLVLVQAIEGQELSGAAAVGESRYAVGDPELVAQAVAVGAGQGESMLTDVELLRLRADIMPSEAAGAAVRAVARLDFDARVAVASRVGMSEVPISLALWGDLAIVASVAGESDVSYSRLAGALDKLRVRMAKRPLIRYLGLASPLASARVIRSGKSVKVVFLLSPKRLALVAERLLRQLQSPQQSAAHD